MCMFFIEVKNINLTILNSMFTKIFIISIELNFRFETKQPN